MKIIAYIAAAIFIFLGAVYTYAAFDPQSPDSYLIPGIISLIIGFGIIWFASRPRPAAPGDTNVTLNVDLPGNVSLDQMTCKNCGGALSSKDVKMVAGAPVVSCPYCGTTYQLTEEPKW
jgi:hypothetical protein